MRGRGGEGHLTRLAGWCALHGFALAFSVVLLAAPAAAANPVLRWRVDNPFRLFTDPADSEVHRATYKALARDERSTPVLSAERALQTRHDDGWAATMFRKTCWDWKANSYGCAEYTDYMNPESHNVVVEIAGLEEAADVTCTWLTAPKGGRELRGRAVTQPCSEPFALTVPYPAGAGIKVEIGGREVLQADMKVQDLLIVGLGDSFASGEGNPDVPVRFSRERTADYGKSDDNEDLTGYPARVGDWRQIGDKAFIDQNARWQDQACHRSLYSHQFRAALQLGVEDPHRAVTFVGLACSGAEVTFGLFLRYKGNEWVPNPPILSQISAAAEAQCGKRQSEALDLPEAYHMNGRIPELKGGLVLRKCSKDYARKIDLVFVSIGGNDVGFSRLVANAVLADQSYLKKLGGWIGEVHGQVQAQSQIVRLESRYKSLNRALHSLLYVPWEQSDRIVLAGYPGMALTGDGSETCKDGRAGMEVVSDFRMSEQKLREGTWVADKLHRTMRDTAYAYGWSFVETHRRAFIDRGICSGTAEDGANSAEELRLPRKVGEAWKPYNPADFRAYASRQRWFRTPNDAFMTGNFHVAASLLQKALKLDSLQWFQLLLASTYSGAFHPTAEGHAAIADAVAEKARTVLQKYGQGSEREPDIVEDRDAPPADEPWVPMPDVPKPDVLAPPPGAAPAPSTAIDASPSVPAAPAAAPAIAPAAEGSPARDDLAAPQSVPAAPQEGAPAALQDGAPAAPGTSVGEPDTGAGLPRENPDDLPREPPAP
ncbi:MAG: hypothetical protein ABL907_03030 [Hyphomicrobium sp.]